MICSCSNETLCLIGNGRESISHGVCRLIDDRGGIDGDSISRGVGSFVDNRVDGVKRSTRFYARGHKSVMNTWLILQKTSKKGKSSIGFKDCALTVKSLLLLARGVLRD